MGCGSGDDVDGVGVRGVGVLAGDRVVDDSGAAAESVCDLLIELGWVTELAGRRPLNKTGRPARCFELNAAAGYVVGMDLGANKVTAVLADLRGDPVAEITRDFSGEHAHATERITTARQAITALLRSSGVPENRLLALAVGIAAPVDDRGRVIAKESYLPGMASTGVRAGIGHGAAWAVTLENDANLAVLGERWRGVASDAENVVILLAGERLGAGLYIGGHLIRGANGGAGELAFLELVQGVGNTDAIGGIARALGRRAVLSAGTPAHPPGSLFALCGGIRSKWRGRRFSRRRPGSGGAGHHRQDRRSNGKGHCHLWNPAGP